MSKTNEKKTSTVSFNGNLMILINTDKSKQAMFDNAVITKVKSNS